MRPLITGIEAGCRQLLDQRVAEGARHDAVDPARQVARDVGRRLARADPDLLGAQQDRVAAELGHAGLEGHVRAQRGLLEEHRERAAAQRLRPLALARRRRLSSRARASIARSSSAGQSAS